MDIEYILNQLKERFFSVTRKKGEHWLWTGLFNSRGKPRVFVVSGWSDAQELSYILTKGSLLPNHRIISNCDIASCIRPDHLFQELIPEPVAPEKPTRVIKVRPDGSPTGSHRGRKQKLSLREKLEIIDKYDARPEKDRWGYQQLLAVEYGVTGSTISWTIKQGREKLFQSASPEDIKELENVVEETKEIVEAITAGTNGLHDLAELIPLAPIPDLTDDDMW